MSPHLGIIGGLGTIVSIDFLAKLAHAAKARSDQEYTPHTMLNASQTRDRNDHILRSGPSPAPAPIEAGRALERTGCSYFVMVRHTAHFVQAELEDAVSLPFLSLIDVTLAAVRNAAGEISRVGVLAGHGCLEAGIYDRACARVGLKAISPDGCERRALMDAIYNLSSQQNEGVAKTTVQRIAQSLASQGAQALIAACTELPMITKSVTADRLVIDPTEDLARCCNKIWRRQADLKTYISQLKASLSGWEMIA